MIPIRLVIFSETVPARDPWSSQTEQHGGELGVEIGTRMTTTAAEMKIHLLDERGERKGGCTLLRRESSGAFDVPMPHGL